MITSTQATAIVHKFVGRTPHPDIEWAAWGGLAHALTTHDAAVASFPTWANRCIRGAISDQTRNATCRLKIGVPTEDMHVFGRHVHLPDPLMRKALVRAWRMLTPREAEAAQLYLVEGCSCDEAAERMGVCHARAVKLVANARRRLQLALRHLRPQATA